MLVGRRFLDSRAANRRRFFYSFCAEVEFGARGFACALISRMIFAASALLVAQSGSVMRHCATVILQPQVQVSEFRRLSASFFRPGSQPRKVHAGKRRRARHVLQENLARIRECFHGRVDMHPQQRANFAVVDFLGIQRPCASAPRGRSYRARTSSAARRRRRTPLKVCRCPSRSDSSCSGAREGAHFRWRIVVHRDADDLHVVRCTYSRARSSRGFPRGMAGTTSPRN